MASVMPPGFVRAYIQVAGKPRLDCYFNPTEYTVTKSNTWQGEEVNGKSSPNQKFSSGSPRKLDVSLLFDKTYPNDHPQSVGEATTDLLDAMETDPTKPAGSPEAAPPFMTFGWGGLTFTGACTSLTVNYKMFSPNGDALRAEVKLSLTLPGPPPKGQNPTTRATPGFGVHLVKDGDTLPSISFGAYGDATKWRLIAEANGVDNPLHLRRGSSLSLPSLEG
jgi:hypothetical protein